MTEGQEEDTRNESRGFYMGVDLGQARDYTAIAIIERVDKKGFDKEDRRPLIYGTEWHLRHCERLPLGTSYADVTRHIKNLIKPFQEEKKKITLVVDATGVGRPVIDSMKEDGLKPVVPVTVTGGQNVHYDDGVWNVPKKDLVSSAKVLLGKGQLKVAKGMPFEDVLINEFQTFHVKVNIDTGHDTYEAWREGAHDDLVFAVALAIWYALKEKGADIFHIPIEIRGRSRWNRKDYYRSYYYDGDDSH